MIPRRPYLFRKRSFDQPCSSRVFAGISGSRSVCATLRNLWPSAAYPWITPQFGA